MMERVEHGYTGAMFPVLHDHHMVQQIVVVDSGCRWNIFVRLTDDQGAK